MAKIIMVVERVEIMRYDASFVPQGHSKDADFVSKQGRTVWQIELPHDRKCSFEGAWAVYYQACSSGICERYCGKDLFLGWEIGPHDL